MYSVQIAVSDGTLARISLSIEYFEKDDITLYRNLETTPLVLGTDWQWDGDTTINLLTNTPVTDGEYITVRRNTNIDRAFNIYDGGAAFSRDTLDENFRQMIYLAQEFTEGNGLTGLFFPLDMHGFKITNLGDGTDPKDAVNKGQLDVVDQRVTNLEESFVTNTVSYPWYELTTVVKDTFSPPFVFDKAAVFLNGICQTLGYSYVVVSNQILLADPVPVGTMFFARLGEDVGLDPDYATADQLAAAIVDRVAEDAALQTQVDSKAAKGVNSDITQITGLTTPLSTAQGGTGNNTGTALTATKLATARALQVALGSTTAASFDGTADVSPGVSGTLPLANGGTGATAAPAARTNLGSGTTGDAVFVASTPLAGRNALQAATYIGVVDGSPASAGNVGEVLTAVSASPVALTSGVAANVTSLALTPGIWEVTSIGQSIPAGGGSSGGVSAGLSTVSATLPTNWYEVYTRGYSVNGTATTSLPTRMFNITTNTTVYCVVNLTFSGGTYTARGTITARRIR
ncbi:tail fibers protein [Dickeya phage BF25/12]|uniref:Tail fibers protein n=1 Tax=Dickeya phage BF25/12 TaxID=1698708 RepID=A0A219MHL0_9CAUD|nr:tail fiber protein [Dickeya phage BF25/12]ALA46459.1 tail fibers protein [Dickeya phage BF25/12]